MTLHNITEKLLKNHMRIGPLRSNHKCFYVLLILQFIYDTNLRTFHCQIAPINIQLNSYLIGLTDTTTALSFKLPWGHSKMTSEKNPHVQTKFKEPTSLGGLDALHEWPLSNLSIQLPCKTQTLQEVVKVRKAIK